MTIILDTHTFLWFVNDDPRLGPRATALIEDLANTRFLSVASAWEIAIKMSLGKLVLAQPFAAFLPDLLSCPPHTRAALAPRYRERYF